MKGKVYKKWQFWILALVVLLLAAGYGFILGRAALKPKKVRTIIYNKVKSPIVEKSKYVL